MAAPVQVSKQVFVDSYRKKHPFYSPEKIDDDTLLRAILRNHPDWQEWIDPATMGPGDVNAPEVQFNQPAGAQPSYAQDPTIVPTRVPAQQLSQSTPQQPGPTTAPVPPNLVGLTEYARSSGRPIAPKQSVRLDIEPGPSPFSIEPGPSPFSPQETVIDTGVNKAARPSVLNALIEGGTAITGVTKQFVDYLARESPPEVDPRVSSPGRQAELATLAKGRKQLIAKMRDLDPDSGEYKALRSRVEKKMQAERDLVSKPLTREERGQQRFPEQTEDPFGNRLASPEPEMSKGRKAEVEGYFAGLGANAVQLAREYKNTLDQLADAKEKGQYIGVGPGLQIITNADITPLDAAEEGPEFQKWMKKIAANGKQEHEDTLRYIMEAGGAEYAAAFEFSTAAWQTAAKLLTVKTLAVGMPGSATGVGKTVSDTLRQAAKFAAFTYVTTEGTPEERQKAAAMAFAYSSTPAISSGLPSDKLAFLADWALNHTISFKTGQYKDAADQAKLIAQDAGEKPWDSLDTITKAKYLAMTMPTIAVSDLMFSLSTKSNRSRGAAELRNNLMADKMFAELDKRMNDPSYREFEDTNYRDDPVAPPIQIAEQIESQIDQIRRLTPEKNRIPPRTVERQLAGRVQRLNRQQAERPSIPETDLGDANSPEALRFLQKQLGISADEVAKIRKADRQAMLDDPERLQEEASLRLAAQRAPAPEPEPAPVAEKPVEASPKPAEKPVEAEPAKEKQVPKTFKTIKGLKDVHGDVPSGQIVKRKGLYRLKKGYVPGGRTEAPVETDLSKPTEQAKPTEQLIEEAPESRAAAEELDRRVDAAEEGRLDAAEEAFEREMDKRSDPDAAEIPETFLTKGALRKVHGNVPSRQIAGKPKAWRLNLDAPDPKAAEAGKLKDGQTILGRVSPSARKEREGKIVKVIDDNNFLVRFKNDNGQVRTVTGNQIRERPSDETRRDLEAELKAMTPKARSKAKADAREFDAIMRKQAAFFDFRAEESGKPQDISKEKKVARERVAEALGETEGDPNSILTRQAMLPGLKKWIAEKSETATREVIEDDAATEIDRDKLGSDKTINEKSLVDDPSKGSLVYKDGEWMMAKPSADGALKLEDGKVIVLDKSESVEGKTVVNPGEPGYETALKEFRIQEGELAAGEAERTQAEREGIERDFFDEEGKFVGEPDPGKGEATAKKPVTATEQDLIQEPIDLSLRGEEGDDGARVQAEKDAAEAAKTKADKDQGDLFDKDPETADRDYRKPVRGLPETVKDNPTARDLEIEAKQKKSAGFADVAPTNRRAEKMRSWLNQKFSTTQGLGKERKRLTVLVKGQKEGASLVGEAKEKRLKQMRRFLGKKYNRQEVNDNLLDVISGRMTPDEFGTKYPSRKTGEIVRELKKMRKIVANNGPVLADLLARAKASEDLVGTVRDNMNYLPRTYDIHVLGEDYTPTSEGYNRAINHIEAGFYKQLRTLGVAIGKQQAKTGLNIMQYFRSGDRSILAGLPDNQRATIEAMGESYFVLKPIIENAVLEGDRVSLLGKADAINKASQSMVNTILNKQTADKDEIGSLDIRHLMKRHLHEALRPLLGEQTDPAVLIRKSIEAQESLIAHLNFFELVRTDSQGDWWDTIPNPDKGLTEPMPSGESARLKYGSMAGPNVYVSKEFKAFLDGPGQASTGRQMWLAAKGTQRLAKLAGVKTTERDYFSNIFFALSSGDAITPGWFKNFRKADKLAGAVLRKNPAAMEKYAQYVRLGIVGKRSSSQADDVAALSTPITRGPLRPFKIGMQKFGEFKSLTDAPWKIASFETWLQRTGNIEESVEHARKFYQNAESVPQIVKDFSQSPFGDYHPFYVDAGRIFGNSVVNVPREAAKGNWRPAIGMLMGGLLATSFYKKDELTRDLSRATRSVIEKMKGEERIVTGIKELDNDQETALRDLTATYWKGAAMDAWWEERPNGTRELFYAIASGNTPYPFGDLLVGAAQLSGGSPAKFVKEAGKEFVKDRLSPGMLEQSIHKFATGDEAPSWFENDKYQSDGVLEVLGTVDPDRTKILIESATDLGLDLWLGQVGGKIKQARGIHQRRTEQELQPERFTDPGTYTDLLISSVEPIKTYRVTQADFVRKLKGKIRPYSKALKKAKALINKRPSEEADLNKLRVDYLMHIHGILNNASVLAPDWVDDITIKMILGSSGGLGLSGPEVAAILTDNPGGVLLYTSKKDISMLDFFLRHLDEQSDPDKANTPLAK